MASSPEAIHAQFEAMVTVSFGFTCGCTQRPSKPVKSIEATCHPGQVIICDRCDQYAMTDRITIRLVPDRKTMVKLMALGMDDDEDFASIVLGDQGKIP